MDIEGGALTLNVSDESSRAGARGVGATGAQSTMRACWPSTRNW